MMYIYAEFSAVYLVMQISWGGEALPLSATLWGNCIVFINLIECLSTYSRTLHLHDGDQYGARIKWSLIFFYKVYTHGSVEFAWTMRAHRWLNPKSSRTMKVASSSPALVTLVLRASFHHALVFFAHIFILLKKSLELCSCGNDHSSNQDVKINTLPFRKYIFKWK